MKQGIFTLLLVAAFQPILNAQWTIAPEAGVNFAKIGWSEDAFDTDLGTQFFAGLHGQYWLSGKMAYGLAAQYSLKGYGVADDDIFGIKARYSYIDFLPNFEIKPWPFLGIFAGVNVGVLVSEEYYNGGEWVDPVFDDFINNVDFGGFIGAKAYLKNFYLKAHFNRGFTPLFDVTFTDDNGQEIGDANFFNQNIQVGLGYRIPLKKKG